MSSVKTTVGRPFKFNKKERQRIASVLRKHGLLRGVKHLKAKGIQLSLNTGTRVAREFGITFNKGRPRKLNQAPLPFEEVPVAEEPVSESLEVSGE